MISSPTPIGTGKTGVKPQVVACHECDLLHRLVPLRAGGEARCTRCGALLRRLPRGGLEAALALFLAAFILFVTTNAFPLLELHWGGRTGLCTLPSSVLALFDADMPVLALMVLLPSLLFPLLLFLSALWLLLPLWQGRRPPWAIPAMRLFHAVEPLGMLGIYLLGVLVAVAKLMDMATVVLGPAFFALVALVLVTDAALTALEPALLWDRLEENAP